MEIIETRTINRMIEEQIKKWSILKMESNVVGQSRLPTITISREPGSGGHLIAEKLAEKLDLDIFDREIIQEMSRSAQISEKLLETIDEKGITVLDDWISALVNEKHIWPDQYIHHLLKVINMLGKPGNAIIVGRGSNFILPPKETFNVRIIAPFEERIKNVAQYFSLTEKEAKLRVLKTESSRKAFIRKYFHEDIENPLNYDMVINTGTITVDSAVDIITCAVGA